MEKNQELNKECFKQMKLKLLTNQEVKIPLIQVTYEGNIHIEITCNNILGIVNSKLIKTYMMIHPKVR